jgi:hypothetical protein
MNRIDTVIETLVNRYGYKTKEAKGFAIEIVVNLDNYLKIQKATKTRFRRAK